MAENHVFQIFLLNSLVREVVIIQRETLWRRRTEDAGLAADMGPHVE